MKIWGGRELMLGGEGGGGNPRAPLPLYETLMCTSTLWVPLPPSSGFSYMLTCIGRLTRWPEALLWSTSLLKHVHPHLCLDGLPDFESLPQSPLTEDVSLILVGTADTSPWYPAYSHHSISPNHEWHGGKTSSSTKSCSQNISSS